MKNCQSADIKKILVSTFNHPKKLEKSEKEMGYPSKGSSYLDLENGDAIAKTDQDNLKKLLNN